MCAPWSVVSACVMLECAAIAQSMQGYPDALTISFLLLGVTSVIHHSRLDEWWTPDIWRWLDYASIVAFSVAVTLRFGADPAWMSTGALVATIAYLIVKGLVNATVVPQLHSVMHLLVGALVLVRARR